MAKIHHVQYMRKKYGGSETLISMISAGSKHIHDIGYAMSSSGLNNAAPSYIRTIRDFEAYFSDPFLAGKDLIDAHFVFPAYYSISAGYNTVCQSHCLFSREFGLAEQDAADDDEASELLESERYYAKLEQEFYPQIPHIVVHSEFHMAELEEKGCSPTYLKLPLAISDFDTGLNRREAKLAIGIPDIFTILFLGRPTHLKGFSVLAEAFSKLSDKKCQLLVVGDFELKGGKIVYAPAVRAKITDEKSVSLHVGERVFSRPPASRAEVPIYFNAADMLVCPSFYEAVGYVNLEAMASRAIVVGSDSTGIPYVVRDNETGLLFKTGDSDDLATKIDLAISDPSLRKRITINAREFVQRFDKDIVIPQYEEYYDSVLRS